MGCGSSENTKETTISKQNGDIKLSKQQLIDKYGKIVIDWVVGEQEEEIKNIISEGFTPDLIFEINGEHQTTLLILSIIYKKTELTKFLINFPQDINLILPSSKDCALISAVRAENFQIIQALLKAGAKKNIKTKDQESLYDISNKLLMKHQQKGNKQGVLNIEKITELLNQQD